MDALSKLLSTRDWLMADGATGTNLFNMGLSSGEPPEFWNVDQPQNILKLYGDAVAAGSSASASASRLSASKRRCTRRSVAVLPFITIPISGDVMGEREMLS